MPKIESEKIDCLHRPCSRPAPRGKIKSVRTHSEVIEQFDSFSLLKLLFLVRNWHCWSRKAFPRQMTPQIREETAKTAVSRQRWQAWKVVRSIAAVRQRPRTPRNWRCSFAFSESFLWHFNKKQHAEVIFRLSRPVSCKNQENGSGKQWSLHAPLKMTKIEKSGGELIKQWHDWLDRIGRQFQRFAQCELHQEEKTARKRVWVLYIQSRRCNVLGFKCEWMWDWCHGSCEWYRRCVNSVPSRHCLTYEYGISVPYLDVRATIANSQIITNLYKKPPNTHQYLPPTSNHPPHICKNLPCGLGLRLRVIDSKAGNPGTPPDGTVRVSHRAWLFWRSYCWAVLSCSPKIKGSPLE